MKIIKILRIVFPILLTLPTFAETIPWNENQVRLGIYSQILEDQDSSLTIESVQNKEFQQSNQTNPSFGFTKSAYWLKFSFNNPEETFKEKLLEITFPLIDEVILYSPENGTYQQTIVGIENLLRIGLSKVIPSCFQFMLLQVYPLFIFDLKTKTVCKCL